MPAVDHCQLAELLLLMVPLHGGLRWIQISAEWNLLSKQHSRRQMCFVGTRLRAFYAVDVVGFTTPNCNQSKTASDRPDHVVKMVDGLLTAIVVWPGAAISKSVSAEAMITENTGNKNADTLTQSLEAT